MKKNINIIPLQKNNEWNSKIDDIRKVLGAPNNPYLFPPHFLKSAFSEIGGKIVELNIENNVIGIGFLFPRNFSNDTYEYTFRLHEIDNKITINYEELKFKLSKLYNAEICFYNPHENHNYLSTTEYENKFTIGRPDKKEALAIRLLQQEIWHSSQDFLYPADIHSAEFSLGVSLVVRHCNNLIGFLFGFNQFNDLEHPIIFEHKHKYAMQLELQLIGVAAQNRNSGIGIILMKTLRTMALQKGINIISLTVDPLQFGSAYLYFGKLKAFTFAFYPNYYSFKNKLNQTSASRFKIIWLINSHQVKQVFANNNSNKKNVYNLGLDKTIKKIDKNEPNIKVNQDTKKIAIEIPSDWTALQNTSPQEALVWREYSDAIFQRYIGCDNGKYIVTGVWEDGSQKYLIAEKLDSALLEKLSAVSL